MNKKTLNKKLALNKRTISNLKKSELNLAKGGGIGIPAPEVTETLLLDCIETLKASCFCGPSVFCSVPCL